MKNSSTVLSANALGHTRGGSNETSEARWKEVNVRMHEIDTLREKGIGGAGTEEERAVEEIRGRIRGWSVSERKEMGMGVVSEVSVVETPERSSVGSEEGILNGLGLERKKSAKEMGGISKTVVIDVKYEIS